jgi:pimeloyl-ACP methyl ester carboxylesterase
MLVSPHDDMNVTAALDRRRVPIEGVRPRLIQAGPIDSGEAVVFVHGNIGSADDWAELVAALGRAGRRALAIDLPDFGETIAAPGFEHSVEGYAGFLERALESLGVERADLVLHDFGGPIGLLWAAEHPEAFASLTLIGTGVLPGYRWHRLARIWRTPVLGELFQAIATRRCFRALLDRYEPRGLPRPFVDAMYDHYDRRTRRAVLDLYRATADPSSAGVGLSPLIVPRNVPSLVIWGEHDAYIPAKYASRQRDAFPCAEIHVLPESGHWPFADAPDTVERLLLEFLAW